MIQYMCKNCGRSFQRYSTAQTLCQLCAFNKYSKPKRPIKRIGKITKRWVDFRNNYLSNRQPDENGYYTCGICLKPVHVDEVVLDHIQPRSSRPDLRFVESNIQTSHYLCNSQKGSKH